MVPLKVAAIATSTLGLVSLGALFINKAFKDPLIKEKIQKEKLQMNSEEEWQKVLESNQETSDENPNKREQINAFIKRHIQTQVEEFTASKDNLKEACEKAKEKPATKEEWTDFGAFCIKN